MATGVENTVHLLVTADHTLLLGAASYQGLGVAGLGTRGGLSGGSSGDSFVSSRGGINSQELELLRYTKDIKEKSSSY